MRFGILLFRITGRRDPKGPRSKVAGSSLTALRWQMKQYHPRAIQRSQQHWRRSSFSISMSVSRKNCELNHSMGSLSPIEIGITGNLGSGPLFFLFDHAYVFKKLMATVLLDQGNNKKEQVQNVNTNFDVKTNLDHQDVLVSVHFVNYI
jgi:hypothetical protein